MRGQFKYFAFLSVIIAFLLGYGGNVAFGQNSPQFDQRSISEDFVLRLVQITTRLRSVGIADAKMINELFAESGDTPFDYALPEGVDDVESVLWSHFFRNTQIYYSHLKSPNPLVAYYDPFSDFFLLTIWDNSSRNPMLVQAGIYPSEVFMDGKSATKLELVPGWLKDIRTKPFLNVLPVMASKAIRSFEKRSASTELPRRSAGPGNCKSPSRGVPEPTIVPFLNASGIAG